MPTLSSPAPKLGKPVKSPGVAGGSSLTGKSIRPFGGVQLTGLDITALRSLDTETTGIDLRHGALPFFINSCDYHKQITFWEFDVDPLTRQPVIPPAEFRAVKEFLRHQGWILQNPKFDCAMLDRLKVIDGREWLQQPILDTLLAGHLLASNEPHDLTSMALVYCGVNIQPYEDALEQATKEAHRLVRSKFPTWLIAKKDAPYMPSAKELTWKFDGWLPRRVAQELGYASDHPWWTVLRDYANVDAEITPMVFEAQLKQIRERGLEKIYAERLRILPIVFAVEDAGVTVSEERLEGLIKEFGEESEKAARVCANIATSYGQELTLPKSGNNKSLTQFVFGEQGLNLDPLKRSEKTGEPSLDKTVIEQYEATLPENSKALKFIKQLRGKRKRDTAIAYMQSYKKFWLSIAQGWYRLHPSLNPTGTATLRWSSANPNEMNISKQEDFTVRYCFGPAPGREWWSLDYDNIELRIPAYESGERVMIEIFEKPNDPPFFGSYHLMNASIVYPDLFWPLAEEKGAFKKKYASTWYQWIKNFGFAVGYGAIEVSGTADRAAHKPGAQRLVMDRLKEHTRLNQSMICHAEEYGYVETTPDKTVDPERGYPLLCSRNNYGRIKPTVPLNFHVQGTAMWCMSKAMVRCHEYLQALPDHHIVMQIHDELVFDIPAGGKQSLPVIQELKRLMELSGDDVGIPLTVSASYHPDNWAKETKL